MNLMDSCFTSDNPHNAATRWINNQKWGKKEDEEKKGDKEVALANNSIQEMVRQRAKSIFNHYSPPINVQNMRLPRDQFK